MDGRGTPLRTWEKLYWGVFVTAISLFLFNRLKPSPEEAKVSKLPLFALQQHAACFSAAITGHVHVDHAFRQHTDDPMRYSCFLLNTSYMWFS